MDVYDSHRTTSNNNNEQTPVAVISHLTLYLRDLTAASELMIEEMEHIKPQEAKKQSARVQLLTSEVLALVKPGTM